MKQPIKKRYYSYNECEKDILSIADRIRRTHRTFTGIYPVSRGGLYLGLRLSHLLNLPLVGSITKDVIIAEDIIDTGRTLHTYKNYFIVTLHYKPKTACFKPWMFARNTSEWIVYFWEKIK